jgi:hypothetical protein
VFDIEAAQISLVAAAVAGVVASVVMWGAADRKAMTPEERAKADDEARISGDW